MLVLQAMHGLSLAQTEYLVADRLSWMRFCGLGPGDAVPDANTLWDFREALIAAGALDALFVRLDRAITEARYLPMSGQIVDATLVAAPRQRNNDAEKSAIKAGRTADEIWPGQAREGAPEGCGRPLDGEILQGEARRRRQTAGRLRSPGLRLQEPHLDRPPARDHPPGQGHRRGGARRREGLIDPNNTRAAASSPITKRAETSSDRASPSTGSGL